MECPKCKEPLSIRPAARLNHEHRMAFKLSPKPGEMMNTAAVGGSLRMFGRLLEAIGRDLGTKTTTLVERIETTDEGEIVFHLLIARVLDDALREHANRPPEP